MDLAVRQSQPIARMLNCDQIDMIAHAAERLDLDMKGLRGVSLWFLFSVGYPPDGNEREIKVMLQDQRRTRARS
jgi:hypothetical protein